MTDAHDSDDTARSDVDADADADETPLQQIADETPLQQIAGGFAIGLTVLVAFSLLAVGYPWFWVAFPVGFAGFVPLVVGIARYVEHRQAVARTANADETADALERLRRRNANGELTENGFESRVSALLETENVGAARESTRRDDAGTARPEREREPE